MSSFAEVQLEILRLKEKSGEVEPILNTPAPIKAKVQTLVGDSAVQMLMLCAQFDIDFVESLYAALRRMKEQ